MIRRFFAFLFGAAFLCVLVVSSIQSVVFDHSFYTHLYADLNLSEKVHVSQDDLEAAIFTMTDYVQGSRDDLSVEVEWRGTTRQAFNEKEIAHMVDVRELWQHAHSFMVVSGIYGIICAIVYIWKWKWDGAALLCRGFILAGACLLVVLLFFGIWAVVDFTGFWMQFHHIFFSNNLWLLNPETDFMIVICPEEMFSSMIFQIIIRFAGMILIAGILCWYIIKKKARIGYER